MKPSVADFHYRTLCLRIVPKTGSTVYLTQYPRDLVMGGHTYLASSGYEFTGYTAGTNLSPAMIDVEGVAGMAGIGYDEISSGVFDGARAYLFATSWAYPVEDQEPIVASILGKTTMVDGAYKIEEMALVDALNQSIGSTYTASCPKRFGGQEYAGCKFNLATVTVYGSLIAVGSTLIVQRTPTGEPDGYFVGGTIQFTSGVNAGLKAMEVKGYSSNGTISTFEGFHYLPAVNDSFILIAGCRKRREDCVAHNNIINFGGFSDIPTSSQYAQIGA